MMTVLFKQKTIFGVVLLLSLLSIGMRKSLATDQTAIVWLGCSNNVAFVGVDGTFYIRSSPSADTLSDFAVVVKDHPNERVESVWTDTSVVWVLEGADNDTGLPAEPIGDSTIVHANHRAPSHNTYVLDCYVTGVNTENEVISEMPTFSIDITYSNTAIDLVDVYVSETVSRSIVGFDFYVQMDIYGSNVDHIQGRQQVKSETTLWNVNTGVNLGDEATYSFFHATHPIPDASWTDSVVIRQDNWALDTNWDWTTASDLEVIDSVARLGHLYDEQWLFGSTDTRTVDAQTLNVTNLCSTKRDFWVEFRIADAPNDFLGQLFWGYQWNNTVSMWKVDDTPPLLTGEYLSGGPHTEDSMFDIYNLLILGD